MGWPHWQGLVGLCQDLGLSQVRCAAAGETNAGPAFSETMYDSEAVSSQQLRTG